MPLPPRVEELLSDLSARLTDLGVHGDDLVREYRTHFESFYALGHEFDVSPDEIETKLLERFGSAELIISQEQGTLRKRLTTAAISSSTNIAFFFLLGILGGAAILSRAPHDQLRGWEAVVLPEAVNFSLATTVTAFAVLVLSGIAAVVLQYVTISSSRFFVISHWLGRFVRVAGTATTGIMTLAAAVFDIALYAHHSSLAVSVIFSLGWISAGALLCVALEHIRSALGRASRLREMARD